MHLVKPTILKAFFLFTIVITGLIAHAQENSPYSRYGLGDLVPNQHISSRGMGGISAAYIDALYHYSPNLQSINFTNPATLGYLSKYSLKDPSARSYNQLNLIFDVSGEIDSRTLKSTTQAKKYNSLNTLISYMSVAFPVASPKLHRKGINGAMAFGLKPQSRINYKIAKEERRPGIDSIFTLFEGSGGASQAYVSTGWRFLLNGTGNKPQTSISFGASAGYTFGNKDYSTIVSFINDTVTYATSKHVTQSNFGGAFFNGGIQFEKQMADTASVFRFGVYGSMKNNLNTITDLKRETFTLDVNGIQLRVDSVFESNNQKGKAIYPASLGAGFTYQNNNWLFGADFETTTWSAFRYNNVADALQNNWTLRAGTQYTPKPTRKYLSSGRYRAGFYYGPDYIKASASSKPYYAITAGASFPLTSARTLYSYGNFASLHTSLEVGSRGNKQSSIRENFVRFSLGVTMNARWFQKPKYD